MGYSDMQSCVKIFWHPVLAKTTFLVSLATDQFCPNERLHVLPISPKFSDDKKIIFEQDL